MSGYINAAISKIYREDDNFIVIGLTGRTGSGCSTVAKILSCEQSDIKHSLFNGDNPTSNEERKQRIIAQHFNKNWQSFLTIQVRSVITLLLSECEIESILEFLSSKDITSDASILASLRSAITEIKSLAEQFLVNKSDDIRVFYSSVLPSKCEAIKNILGESAFVKLYQLIGVNIRNSGSPINDTQIEGGFFTLAEKINSIVKEIKTANNTNNKKTFIVIDAIRNPLEAIYFQDRYATFFLLAVSCHDNHRKQRLRDLGYSDAEIKIIDSQEYIDRDIDEESAYVLQDIQGCLQRADLYINNPDSKNKVSEFRELTNHLLKFISLMKHPGLVTPTAIERCMQIAYTAKLNSGCISRQVGAIITDSHFSVQAVGWNDVPHGQVPCNIRSRFDLISGKDQIAYSEYEKTENDFLVFFRDRTNKFTPILDTGRNISYCFKSEYNKMTGKDNQVHTRSLHAEENAFLQISKYGGRGIEGGKLFTTASPCELCAKKAYQLGIMQIYYIDPYPGIAMRHVLMGGVKNPELILFSGAIGRAFHRLYTPIVAYKDELNALVI